MTQVLLLCGGLGAEHAISLRSADYLAQELKALGGIEVIRVEITAQGWQRDSGESVAFLMAQRALQCGDERIAIDYAIPCLHGFPGETGQIPALFELAQLPYLGADLSASLHCFNKVTHKLWLQALGVPNTPFVVLHEANEQAQKQAMAAWQQFNGELFIKAASQGSSIGCYAVCDQAQLWPAICQAFEYSDQVLIEPDLKPRELEVAAYWLDGALQISAPGEIITPNQGFYSYEEKYAEHSHSRTQVLAEQLTGAQRQCIEEAARRAFQALKLRDLARIDFFIDQQGAVYLNEINTFPGMTPISMFPKMMVQNGHKMGDFLAQAIQRGIQGAARSQLKR